jgi:hypothetical protein
MSWDYSAIGLEELSKAIKASIRILGRLSSTNKALLLRSAGSRSVLTYVGSFTFGEWIRNVNRLSLSYLRLQIVCLKASCTSKLTAQFQSKRSLLTRAVAYHSGRLLYTEMWPHLPSSSVVFPCHTTHASHVSLFMHTNGSLHKISSEFPVTANKLIWNKGMTFPFRMQPNTNFGRCTNCRIDVGERWFETQWWKLTSLWHTRNFIWSKFDIHISYITQTYKSNESKPHKSATSINTSHSSHTQKIVLLIW